jgi:hypothetical protein
VLYELSRGRVQNLAGADLTTVAGYIDGADHATFLATLKAPYTAVPEEVAESTDDAEEAAAQPPLTLRDVASFVWPLMVTQISQVDCRQTHIHTTFTHYTHSTHLTLSALHIHIHIHIHIVTSQAVSRPLINVFVSQAAVGALQRTSFNFSAQPLMFNNRS